ncbi:signal transduction histidine kinase [Clostridium tetanomorphum]|uniref:histidine kinase n=1 Tax=Clostridium tetanomorphum TaxID=1553 RepID=A0A923EBZ9_CLOTT|nr:HAMP domain-containing sensor histidine kinase [Clostridium tetanomorphum]KAJ50607.1 sensor histidine kinase [Clostridium tetanomorphum DSM 665]MBC2399067.1 HAMP domain-containing protein [Clostridium tetanomorphum]MBP1862682.1 signal transduction histidine kinase [Clostridium tetanomorphum]NRS85478.1 signal transduction histidine kinase [Clostridium tetanomorphum]NRZ98592.1 signal transduction histidine kinase [Clostridium tetanomorphum]
MKLSIRYKILVSFSFVFLIGITLLIYSTEKIINKNNEFIIKNEMIQGRKDIDMYLKQYFVLNNIEPSKSVFKIDGKNIVEELSYKVGDEVILYSDKGELLWKTYDNNEIKSDNKELKLALEGKTSYSINKIKDKVVVNLCYPVYFKSERLGLIGYCKEYTELYGKSNHIVNTIKIIGIILFLVILILSFIISKRITKPITELTEASKEVSRGNFNVKFKKNSGDEIGELALNFKYMVDKIKNQILTIEKDRDTLRNLEMSRKAFFDNVTHELKTPITTILGYAEIIEKNGFEDENFFKKGVSHIISESKRLNRMVIELLELSKNTTGDFNYNFTKVHISKLLKITCEEMSIRGKRYNIQIVNNIEEDLWVNGDEDKLKEIFINLIDNSIKYGYVNSIIEVEGVKKHSKIVINIKDRGDGIPKEELENIFQPFYRINKKVSRKKGGNGLGLPIVKAIVEKHGGNIYIESKIEQETKVSIEIPCI